MSPPALPTSSCMLASNFLHKTPRRNRWRFHSLNLTETPAWSGTFVPSDLLIPQLHRAPSSEFVYLSIIRFYTSTTESFPGQLSQITWTPARNTHPHTDHPEEEIYRISIQVQNIYLYLPEEIYVSSVLPMRTPRELQYFQDHCWQAF